MFLDTIRSMSDMTAYEIVRAARNGDLPPATLSPTLRVLWLAIANHWDEAHEQCQHLPTPWGEWIHAHLHRQEGDLSNAAYWYQRAGKIMPQPSLSIEDEWMQMTERVLSNKQGN